MTNEHPCSKISVLPVFGSLNYCMICIFSYSLDSVTVIKYCWKYAGINYWAISISGKHARVHELMPMSVLLMI